MSHSIGIVGLPNVGKSTLFKALTAQPVDTSNYPFATIDPNVGIVAVPDNRLDTLQKIILAPTVTPAVIEFYDIAGLARGAHKGEGLGNEFLGHIQQVDALAHVLRAFHDTDVEHVEGNPDPARDYDIVRNELQQKDGLGIGRHRDKLNARARSADRDAQEQLALLLEVEEAVEKGAPPKREEPEALARQLGLLSTKPEFIILNTGEETVATESLPHDRVVTLPLQQEVDIADLSTEERFELGVKTKLNHALRTAYDILELITFFTIKGGEELRAWPIPARTTAPEAGGIVHNDFQEQFIRTEVIVWDELVSAGGWKHARAQGRLRTEGRDYIVQDGDVIEFKI